MGKRKHGKRNKDRASLGSIMETSTFKTTSIAGSTSDSAPASSAPSTPVLYNETKPFPSDSDPGRVVPRIFGWPRWDWVWRPTAWLDAISWSPRFREYTMCRAVRWFYKLCTTSYRTHWTSQRCRDLLITLAMAASCMYSLYLVLEFVASQVATAQGIDASCSVVYVTIPGPIITVSFIAASPSNPAKGTFYFSVINGTTGWLDGIAPPSRFNTLPTRTPDVTPVISSLPSAGTISSSQASIPPTGSSGTLDTPPSALPPPATFTTLTTTTLSGSTLVTTVITTVVTPNIPVSSSATTSNPNPAQSGALRPSFPANEPQRPWPSPMLSSSAVPNLGSSSMAPLPAQPSSLPMSSSSLGPIGSSVSLILSSTSVTISSPTSTILQVTPGLSSNILSTEQRTTSVTLITSTTTISGEIKTDSNSAPKTTLSNGPSTTPPITTISTIAPTVSGDIPERTTPSLTSLPTSTVSRGPSIVSSSKDSALMTSTRTFSGGATSVLIGFSTTSTSAPPTVANPSLGGSVSSRILTTRSTPGGSITITTTIPNSAINLSSNSPDVSSTAKTLSPSSGSLGPSLSPVSTTGSVKITVSLSNPSTGPGASPSPSATSVTMTTSTSITLELTKTGTMISSAPSGQSGSSTSLPPSMTRSSSLITPDSTSWLSHTITSSSMTMSSFRFSSTSGDSFSTSKPLTPSPSIISTTRGSMLTSSSGSLGSSLMVSLASSSFLTLSSSSIILSSVSSFSRSLSTINSIPTSSSTGSSSMYSSSDSSWIPPTPTPLSSSTINLPPSFSNLTSSITNSTTSSRSWSSSSTSSSTVTRSSSLTGSSILSSRASQSWLSIASSSSETGFMSIQTETTASRSRLSPSSIMSSSLSSMPLGSSSPTLSISSSGGGTVTPTSNADASLLIPSSSEASGSMISNTPRLSPTSTLSEDVPFQVRDLTTKVISYGDTAFSFIFPSPDITTTISYWTGVYPTVTGPLPSDLQTLALTTRTERKTPLSALPSFELFSSRQKSFKTVVTTIYDDDDADGGIAKRQDTQTTTSSSMATAAVPIPAVPEPTLCGESGNFTLTFDDTVVSDDDGTQLAAKGMKNPYHHLFYANGFTNVPDKWEPFPAISQPNVAMFLPLQGKLLPNTAFAGSLLPGEIGAGPRASVKAYWFNAYSGYFGCALNGLTPCTLRISGFRYDEGVQDEVLVAEQNVTIPACWGYLHCRLTQIFFNDAFRALSGIQFNAYTYNLGIPQVHMMDDLQLEWYNNTCSAGILRIGHM